MLFTTVAFAGACIATSWAAPSIASTGCGKPHAAGYHDTHTSTNTPFSIESNNKTRKYGFGVPKNYNPNKQYPLIFDFHGSSETPFDQSWNSQYLNYSNDYLIVYPRGLGLNWQGPTYAKGSNDLLFTSDLLAHLKTQYCIDSTRIYASGKSNGGGFVDTLACSNEGDAFAAFAMASAALYTDLNATACHGKRRAILEAHGDKDTIIPYHPTAPGRGGPLPDVGQWVSWWGQRDCGKSVKPTVDSSKYNDGHGYNFTSYSCNGRSGVVQHYHLAKGGHCWPNVAGDNFDTRGDACKGARVVDFTPKVLEFFSKFTLGSGGAPRTYM